MPNTFNVGDVVRLKSGGPKMTITKVMGDSVETGAFPNEFSLQYDIWNGPAGAVALVEVPKDESAGK